MAYYGKGKTPLECEIPFGDAKENFYRAAKYGMQANVKWAGGKSVALLTLLERSLLPDAKKGLQMVGLRPQDIDHYLDDIIGNRIKTRQNGAAWQRAFIAKHGLDFQNMTHTYFENQRRNLPVYQWTL